MGLYINRPVAIDLRQWTGSNFTEIYNFLNIGNGLTDNGDGTLSLYNFITISQGDWVTHTGQVISPGAFATTYQPINTSGDFYALASNVADLYIPARQVKTVMIPALGLFEKKTLTVTWDTAMPSAAYSVAMVPQGSTTIVGAVTWSVVSGTQTANGLDIEVKATLAVSVGTIALQVSAQQ